MSEVAGALATAACVDDAALAALVRAYHDRVYRFGRRVCRDGYDADDAVQEAFTKLATRPEVAADPGVMAWLFKVVLHQCRRMLRPFARARKALGEQVPNVDVVPAETLDPAAAFERWRLVEAVHTAIATLDRPYREVLVLRDLEGLTGAQTCNALGISEATMKTRLHTARGELRRTLERAGHGEGARG